MGVINSHNLTFASSKRQETKAFHKKYPPFKFKMAAGDIKCSILLVVILTKSP